MGQRAQGGDVLGALVADAERAIDDARAVANEEDGEFVAADVEFDLLEDADRTEGAQGVDDGTKAALGQARGDADHVLLGDTGVDVLVREIDVGIRRRARSHDRR